MLYQLSYARPDRYVIPWTRCQPAPLAKLAVGLEPTTC
jgi:hypothetical protein